MVTHPTAVVADDTVLGTDVVIGPLCVVGLDGGERPPVQLGAGSTLRSHAVVYRGTTIGAGFHAGHHSLVREDTVIGDRVSIGSSTVIEHHVRIADGVRVHGGCFIPEYSVLDEGAWIGPAVTLTNARYPNRPDTKDNLEGVHVGKGAVIGAAAVILPGVKIGEGAIVGAGAVVVSDVPAGATVIGNPGRSPR